MIFPITLTYAPETRALSITNGSKPDFTIGAFGKFSYSNELLVHMNKEDEIINLQIGNYCSIGHQVTALINRDYDHQAVSTSPYLPVRPEMKRRGQILIGHDVWIGNGAVLMAGRRIGNGAVIGARTVVSKDVPPYTIAVGNPMTLVRKRFTDEQIEKLLAMRWWNWENDKLEANKSLFADDIDAFLERFYEPPPAAEPVTLDRRRHTVLLMPDFEDPYPVWPKVVQAYLDVFDEKDDVSLVLNLPNDEQLPQNLARLQSAMPDTPEYADVVVTTEPPVSTIDLIRNMESFVTTRSRMTMDWTSCAHNAGVEIISGVDSPIFDPAFIAARKT